jgi:hypothetical protein
MKIDASRYRLFCTNPDEFRLKYLWNLQADSGSGAHALVTFGRRRGSAFHDLLDGVPYEGLEEKYGDTAAQVAKEMYEANQAYSARLLDEVVWREKEFCKSTSSWRHQIVGRIDTLMRRWDEEFLLDYKTTKARTKADMQAYRNALAQSPQVDFYMLATGIRKFVFRILWRDAKKKIQISELEVRRAEWELKAFAHGVVIIADTIEHWTQKYGIEQPWPRATTLAVAPENYQFAPIYQRTIYEGMQNNLEGFSPRVEHLSLAVEDEEGEEDGG